MIGLSEIEEKRSYSQLQALMKKLQSSVISPSVEHLKEIALETRSTNLSSRDLDVLYEYISKHQAQFLNITKVYLEHDIQNMNSECLNFIFIISSLVQCRKESEDNQNNTLSELSELNSSLEVMNYEIVDVKTQKIFDKLSESKLNYDKLYQLLTKKGKQSKFNYLACDYDANQEISIQNHRLGYVYTEIQRYQEALQTLNNVKEQSKEIPRFLIQTIINCNLAQQKILGPESLDQYNQR